MADATGFVSVYVTAAGPEAAERLARALLERRLVACANVMPTRSYYWWDGAVQADAEVTVFMKTRASLADAVVAAVADLHDYDVPCCVVLPIAAGHGPYLDWVRAETNGPKD